VPRAESNRGSACAGPHERAGRCLARARTLTIPVLESQAIAPANPPGQGRVTSVAIQATSAKGRTTMSLFIACVLIYHFEMEWWWYGVAVVIYAGHLALLNRIGKRR